MPTLPYANRTPGLHQAITTTTASDAIAVPERATGVVLYFTDADGAVIEGRVAFSTDDTPITVDDTNMGWHPAMPIQSDQKDSYTIVNKTAVRTALYLHVACATASAVAKGFWLFATDTP